MMSDRDAIQDEMIRRNAENIRRNEEAILRQTVALEKIRDHYFPQRTWWKRLSLFFLKAVGAVTVAAGVLEAVDWLWNVRKAESMAGKSAAVAHRLLVSEGDFRGAERFLEKAIELDDGAVEYRVRLAYVKGMAAIADLFDLGRPLSPSERERLDSILADALFLQEVAPKEAMSQVLMAQVYCLRGEGKAALAAVERAIALDPSGVQARVTACAMNFAAGDGTTARRRLDEARSLDPDYPLVRYWQGFFALSLDHDAKTALAQAEALIARAPRFAAAHILKGQALAAGDRPDWAAAREAYAQALVSAPNSTRAMTLTAETLRREGRRAQARLWLDRALELDGKCMKALTARARLALESGDARAAAADLDTAIALAPFRADLYRDRAQARLALGDKSGAAADGCICEELTRESR